MVTPKREQIKERAFEIDAKRNYDISTNTPEISELQEDGIYEEARDELMTNQEQSQVMAYVEKMANSMGFELQKTDPSALARQVKPYDFEIDMHEALKSGLFIAGGKQCGKTNLAKKIADLFMKRGHIVKVFDLSQQWLDSSIPYTIEVNEAYLEIPLYKSMVFDLSKLYASQIKSFIAQVLAKEFSIQVATSKPERRWIVYVLEECQILIPQGKLRSKEAQEVLRLLSSGANYNLSYVAITQRPSTVDTTVMELAYQKYFARCDGENDKRKIASYIGNYAETLDSLNIGEFIYDKGDTTKKIAVPLFASTVKPKRLATPSKVTPQQAQATTEIDTVAGIAIGILSLIGLTWIVQSVLM